MDMESPLTSSDRLKKMNNSSLAFKQLIQSLRNKNKYAGRQVYSEVNPQSEVSSNNKNYASQASWNKQPTKNHSKNQPHSFPIDQDQIIKIKPRGNIAGRDILQKKPTALPNSKFNQTLAQFKGELKNKNLQNSQLQKAEPIYPKINTSMVNIPNKTSNQPNLQVPNMQKAKSFNQHRLNQKVLFRKRVKDLDEELVIKYYQNSNGLSDSSKAPEIFDFFQGLILAVNVLIPDPFIKKYKNCIYFGHPIDELQKYEGFLYFYDKKFYFGEFMNGQKSGHGTEIYFDDSTVYKGIFNEGQKSGKFMVTKPNEQYLGLLEKGLYHGQGKLTTKQSVYEGNFQKGYKHGFGEEVFPATGLKFTGYFNKGHFQKRSKNSFTNSNSQTQAELGRGIKFRNTNDHLSQFSQTQATRKSYKNHHKSFERFGKSNYMEKHDDVFGTENPFSSYKPYIQNSKRNFYNKDKILHYPPQIRNPPIDSMPQNCQQFDYSFDVSSRKDSEMSQFGNRGHKKQGPTYGLDFPQIQQERMDTTEYEQPLPVPCFYVRR